MLRIDIFQGPHKLFYNTLGTMPGILRNRKKHLTCSYTLEAYNSLGEIKMYIQMSWSQSRTKTCRQGFKKNKNAVRGIRTAMNEIKRMTKGEKATFQVL